MKNLYIKLAYWLIISATIIWFANNIYYGWYLLPINETEKTIDYLVAILYNLSFISFVYPGVKLYLHVIDKYLNPDNRDENNKLIQDK